MVTRWCLHSPEAIPTSVPWLSRPIDLAHRGAAAFPPATARQQTSCVLLDSPGLLCIAPGLLSNFSFRMGKGRRGL